MDVGLVDSETCTGCGVTVEVDSPAFLFWDADLVGSCLCPDCSPALEPSGSETDDSERLCRGDDLGAEALDVVETRPPRKAA